MSHIAHMGKDYRDIRVEMPVWEEWKKCKKLKELEIKKDITNSDLLGFLLRIMFNEPFILDEIKSVRG